jgi:hypothetical protein
MAAPVSQAWTYGASGVDTATWNGTATVTDTVTSGGAFLCSFSSAIFGSLTTPLPGWPLGNPS